MNIIIFTHPSFLVSKSMPKYAVWLANGMRERGHQVEIWTPKPLFYNIPGHHSIKKWLGYIDQYIIFPITVSGKLKNTSEKTLFVFSDHALGPWVPTVSKRNHVIHCHDLLAQQSALGQITENPTGLTGKIYQSYIRKGYSKGDNFISISKKTQVDLHKFLGRSPRISKIVYNGLTQDFEPSNDLNLTRKTLSSATNIDLNRGYILHVGGNQWYKNRRGVVEIYDAWRKASSLDLPLLLIGASPNNLLLAAIEASSYKNNIYTLVNKSDEFVRMAYSGATVFLFPSLAEGFGWPIAEAMASGCPVITTELAPMTEVGGNASTNIPRRPVDESEVLNWATICGSIMEGVVCNSGSDRQNMITLGLENVKRFDSNKALNEIEIIYKMIIQD